jgi:hypothetical protein
MRRIAAAALAIGTAAACVRNPRGEAAPAGAPTRLCVRNEAQASGNIVARAGLVRFDVVPGEEVCKQVTPTEPSLVLRAETVGGGANGPVRYANRLQAGSSGCWRWRLTDIPGSALDLLPCDASGDGRGSPAPH